MRTHSEARYATLILLVVALNLVVQEDVARLILPAWESPTIAARGPLVANPLDFSTLQGRTDLRIDPVVPSAVSTATKEERGRAPNVLDFKALDPRLAGKIEVLFVGDSTLAWGIGHDVFQMSSDIEAASITFDMNVPDEALTRLLVLYRRCFMAEDGAILLSFSANDYWRTRGGRLQDKGVRDLADSGSCDDLVKQLHAHRAAAASSQAASAHPRSALWSKASYKARVAPFVEYLEDHLDPFWSPHIGIQSLWPREPLRPPEERDLLFLRWNPTYWVPYMKRPGTWRYEALDPEARHPLPAWEDDQLQLAKRRMEDLSARGAGICHVIPITSKAEHWRYDVWLANSDRGCLVSFPEILNSYAGIAELEMRGQNHLANESGPFVSAVLGRFFAEHYRDGKFIFRRGEVNRNYVFGRVVGD